MWTYLTPWIVDDNQLPAVAVGTELAKVGLSIFGELVDPPAPANATQAISEVSSGGLQDGYEYLVTGIASNARDRYIGQSATRAAQGEFLHTEFVLDCGWLRLRGLSPKPVAERIGAHSVVSIRGLLAVLPNINGGADIADFVQDWTVARIQVEQYTVNWREMHGAEGEGLEGTQGEITALHEIDHIDRRSDDETYADQLHSGTAPSTDFAYVLDLRHLPSA